MRHVGEYSPAKTADVSSISPSSGWVALDSLQRRANAQNVDFESDFTVANSHYQPSW